MYDDLIFFTIVASEAVVMYNDLIFLGKKELLGIVIVAMSIYIQDYYMHVFNVMILHYVQFVIKTKTQIYLNQEFTRRSINYVKLMYLMNQLKLKQEKLLYDQLC
jgi:hypothetical protein